MGHRNLVDRLNRLLKMYAYFDLKQVFIINVIVIKCIF